MKGKIRSHNETEESAIGEWFLYLLSLLGNHDSVTGTIWIMVYYFTYMRSQKRTQNAHFVDVQAQESTCQSQLVITFCFIKNYDQIEILFSFKEEQLIRITAKNQNPKKVCD